MSQDHHAGFSPAAYGPVFGALLGEARLPQLGPGQPNESMRQALENVKLESAFAPDPIADEEMARACLAGLWLYHDFLEQSHALSQEIHTPTGSYWHGLMHRREPDADNAKYWFRRVGQHPLFEILAREANELGLPLEAGRWNPFDFIDLCEKHRGTGAEQEILLRRLQQREWELLFGWCYRQTTGPRPNRINE